MKKLFNEFKEFALRGNVIDMAVGVIIGGAFGKIVSSLVEDVIMPVLSALTGRVNLSEMAAVFGVANGEPIEIRYGLFLQNVLDFVIVALCVFIAIKAINSRKNKAEEPEKPPEPPEPPKQEQLLTEIRDLLKNGNLSNNKN